MNAVFSPDADVKMFQGSK